MPTRIKCDLCGAQVGWREICTGTHISAPNGICELCDMAVRFEVPSENIDPTVKRHLCMTWRGTRCDIFERPSPSDYVWYECYIRLKENHPWISSGPIVPSAGRVGVRVDDNDFYAHFSVGARSDLHGSQARWIAVSRMVARARLIWDAGIGEKDRGWVEDGRYIRRGTDVIRRYRKLLEKDRGDPRVRITEHTHEGGRVRRGR